MQLVVWITTEFVGWHRWSDAPPNRAYLSNVHRHLFKVKVTTLVPDPDRHIEFHDLKDIVDEVIKKMVVPYMTPERASFYSCEQIAIVIAGGLKAQNITAETVSVSEDGECGAEIRTLPIC